MGFNEVYRCLMEMFPQIDTRLLKAVAIEHSKDADAAAIIVLTEILPSLSKKSLTSSSIILGRNASTKDLSLRGLSDEIAESEEREELNTRCLRRNRTQCSSLEQGSKTSGCATGTDLACAHNSDAISLDKAMNASAVSQSYDPSDSCAQFSGNTKYEEVILSGKTHESVVEVGANKVSVAMPNLSQASANTESKGLVSLDKGRYTDVKVEPEQTPIVMSTLSIHADGVANGSLTTWNDFDGPGATGGDISNCGISQEVGSCVYCPLEVDSSVAQLVPSSVQEKTSNVPESGFQLEIGSTSTFGSGKPDAIGSSDLKSKPENSMNEKSDIEDYSIHSTINTVVTRSGQICRIDLLEEMIEDAKNNKLIILFVMLKKLFIAMESIMNMMSEVEIQEKAAKAAAEKGGLDIFVKMEELKQMLAHAKETNDMHAGEIHGEKAILATEAGELQNRLLSLSEERDKSLAILDEMLETLEARLAAAEEIRKAAEKENFEREESARVTLAEQEATKEKVVQESKLLQQQAEENSKLREFLMDCGRLVDSLQGEISVICLDVRLLKEKFDECVPLSNSVSSSQTTCILASSGLSLKSMASLVAEQGLTSEKFDEHVPLSKSVSSSQTSCILASSDSSLKSMASLVAEQGLTSKTTSEKVSSSPSVDARSPKSSLDDKKHEDEWRQLSDEWWDLLENETELNGNALPE